ncbi:Clavaminate synthase-like protein [Boletus coccyginus]|nr:Clavaminate synthase-like protein [Boletus coccyginus]
MHYPPTSLPVGVGGIGTHTEFCFTFLCQDSVPALQVMDASGEWIDAVPTPGCLVVNLGDQFARFTSKSTHPSNYHMSTPHRASNASGQERYPIPVFFGADSDVKLEPIPGCVTEDNPAKYEVVTEGDYVKSRLDATFVHPKGHF